MEQTITLFDLSDIGGKGKLQLSNLTNYTQSGLTLKKAQEAAYAAVDGGISKVVEYVTAHKVFAREDIPVNLGKKLNPWVAKRALFVNCKPKEALTLLQCIVCLIITSEEIDVNKAFYTWRKHNKEYTKVLNLARAHNHVKKVKSKKHYSNFYLEEHNANK